MEMDNYLSDRWPKGPGVQPPPVPVPGGRPAAPKRRRRWIRPLAVTMCVVLALALLCSISYWSINSLADYLDQVDPPSYRDDFPALPSFSISHSSDWTADDLPWGDPDPSMRLSLAPAEEAALSAPDIYERILPSLVYIEVETEEGRASGTGVIVSRSGYVLTNYHIIDESTEIYIEPLAGQSGGSRFDGEVIGFDEEFDIAVLQFSAPGLIPAVLGDSDALRVGDAVYAIGNPMGNLLGSMTEGIVSALGRDEEVGGDGMVYIQTSAAINPGNSGGALVNSQGQVVGVTSAKITGLVLSEDSYSVEDSAVIENLGLALPTADILPFVNHIFATGKSCRPAIGVEVERQRGQQGLLVKKVDEGVPAQAAGLTKGDRILQADGQPVDGTDAFADLRRVLYRAGVGGEVTLTVLRDGEELEIAVTLIDNMEED